MVTEEEAEHVESGGSDEFLPDWQRENLPKVRETLASEEYVPLPTLTETESYLVMEHFCNSIEQPVLRAEFEETIRGRGAFRRFKHAIHVHEIAEDWYRFRRGALKALAADFLSSEAIPFSDEE